MSRTARLNYKDATRARVSARIKQLFVLVLTVIIGILISVTVNAQPASGKGKREVVRFEKKSITLPTGVLRK
jgi:hypothetical protein